MAHGIWWFKSYITETMQRQPGCPLAKKIIIKSLIMTADLADQSGCIAVCTEPGHPVIRDDSQGCWMSSSFYEVVRSDECLSGVTSSYI